MVFNSLTFLIFLPAVPAGYYLLPRRARTFWLLAASYVFYASWNVKYTALILISTGITYLSGLLIPKGHTQGQKKAVVAGSLLLNFGILTVFKYGSFLMMNLNHALYALNGSMVSNPFTALILPVGISFYTFQAVGYTIDVYRGDTEPERDFFRYALFVAFFPQLVAGPIERSGRLLSQIRRMERERIFSGEQFMRGAYTALYGYMLKVILADRIAALVQTVYEGEHAPLYAGYNIAMAALLFSLQIYGDFAGYTYIAIGCARMLGFSLCENFNTPYLARGIRDFWDRWHMSLTSWFRDYLYFPLGGSRKGKLRKMINILIVFLVSGLWHGAAWHFVLWGAVHGIARVLEEVTEKPRRALAEFLHYDRDTFAHRLLQEILTFLFVSVCWIFFRAESAAQAFDMIRRMVTGAHLAQLTDGSLLNLGLDGKDLNVLIVFGSLMILLDVWKKKGRDVAGALCRQNTWFQFLLLFAGIVCIVLFGAYGPAYDAAAFLYFQF